MTITKYLVEKEHSRRELETTIEKRLAEGWLLQGGVSVSMTPGSDYVIYAQALVKGTA